MLRLREPPEEPDPAPVLTWRQYLVLRVIKASVDEHGYSPTFAEIGEAASTSSAWYLVKTLMAKGYLVVGEDAVIRRRSDAGGTHRPGRRGPGTISQASWVRNHHACPQCRAGKGDMCVSARGKLTRDLHMARWREAT